MTNDSMRCSLSLPPAGWYCPRTPGHNGPCAAVRDPWWIRLIDWLTTPISKPATVEYRYPDSGFPELRAWREYGSYPNTQTAQEVVANKTRSATTAEYRIKT